MRRPSVLLLLAVVTLTACGGSARGPYSGGDAAVARDPERSRALHERAREKTSDDPAVAEALLRQALDADLYNGPAHNNLGVLLLERKLHYEAIQEFEWARKLLPGHPDPRTNLAIALEASGRPNDAIAAAHAALEAQPEYLPAMQALAVIQVRAALETAETQTLLARIQERSPDPVWRTWAEGERLRLEANPR